jgi:outer membrane protein assembly factor BamD (BamD/ComL family)
MRCWLVLLGWSLVSFSLLGDDPAPKEPLAPPADPPPPAAVSAPPVKADPAAPSLSLIKPSHSNEGDGEIRDSIGSTELRPMPDTPGTQPLYFARVDYLRKHNDNIMAAAYLRQIINNGDLSPQYRARSILELADTLDAEHQPAESLCWLKLWMELYPTRPEAGAVCYRIGTLYSQMGLPALSRDAFYLALAHTVNEGQVHTPEDLQRYTRLTVGILWGMAANEYQNGQWARAAELFDRFQKEAPSASPLSQEKAAYLQADCYYQLRQVDNATKLYEQTLEKHPFNPLAPEARLRLYHLYTIQKQPQKAAAEIASLAWTVRTVWPKDETYWQKQTAQLLLSLNQKNAEVLPPLYKESAQLPPEGKTWQEALNHYDALVNLQSGPTQAHMASSETSSSKTDALRGLPEDAALLAVDRYLNQLLPAPPTASNP